MTAGTWYVNGDDRKCQWDSFAVHVPRTTYHAKVTHAAFKESHRSPAARRPAQRLEVGGGGPLDIAGSAGRASAAAPGVRALQHHQAHSICGKPVAAERCHAAARVDSRNFRFGVRHRTAPAGAV